MTGVRVEYSGDSEYAQALIRTSPQENPDFIGRALRRIGLETQGLAANELIRGGQGPAVPGKLTSRTGTGRRSISTDFSELPFIVSVGSTLGYMALHESGGDVAVPAHTVRAHRRTVVFGRTVSPFDVPAYRRSAHSKRVSARPWLSPAVDKMVPTRAEEILAQEAERVV